ncbi:G-protein-coupled inward rectifier potassium channel [Anopheles sinensis]|uniref:G-protein-coupled inward rectifier potassium channel n=1 Tax=Anopheles sinensis TaxID=74873 RepID=A0A084VBD1_ANOSI|nr:G-protein-coupled inward rectifier potassium channel [Anopheles sinensis]
MRHRISSSLEQNEMPSESRSAVEGAKGRRDKGALITTHGTARMLLHRGGIYGQQLVNAWFADFKTAEHVIVIPSRWLMGADVPTARVLLCQLLCAEMPWHAFAREKAREAVHSGTLLEPGSVLPNRLFDTVHYLSSNCDRKTTRYRGLAIQAARRCLDGWNTPPGACPHRWRWEHEFRQSVNQSQSKRFLRVLMPAMSPSNHRGECKQANNTRNNMVNPWPLVVIDRSRDASTTATNRPLGGECQQWNMRAVRGDESWHPLVCSCSSDPLANCHINRSGQQVRGVD